MKKYRLTKITVKTREIVSLVKNAAGANHISVCPVCQTPVSASLPAAETNFEKRPAMLSPAKNSDNNNKQNN